MLDENESEKALEKMKMISLTDKTLKVVSSFDILEMKNQNEISTLLFITKGFIVWTTILEKSTTHILSVWRNSFIFPAVSVNEIYGMQMLLFVNVVL